MPEFYGSEYVAAPDDVGFTRAAIRAGNLARVLQANLMHLYGTRLVRLVADEDLWVRVDAGPAYSTEPVWHATVPAGVTRLLGTVIWVGTRRGPGRDDDDTIAVRFTSERGGAGVAGGLDVVNAAVVSDALRAPGRASQGSAFDNLDVHDGADGAVTRFPYGARILGGDAHPIVQDWAPNLTTSNEQRIEAGVRGGGFPYLWGVWVFGLIPAGG